MKKNVAGQTIGAQLVTAAAGAAFTGAATVYVTGDGGTQAVGSVGAGACVHEGNGYHSYAPAQAETNFAHVAFTFVGSGAVPATVQVFTGFPQTADAPTTVAIAAAVWALVAEGSYTALQLLRGIAAACLGKVSGADTGHPVFRSADDTAPRIDATVSGSNRTAVTLTLGP